MSLVIFAIVLFALVLAVGSLPFLSGFAQRPIILHRMTVTAAGFLIGAALLVALPEGFELFIESQHDEDHHDSELLFGLNAPLIAGLAVLMGFLVMLILEGLGFGHDLHEEHHDHAAEHGHDHLNHPTGSAKNVVIGLSLHSIMDGLILGSAFALGELVLSMQLALVILMHKFPAAFSLSGYSLHERNDRNRSKIDLVLFALTTPIAMILAAQFFETMDEMIVALMLLFSAGSFIYVATVDVLPNIHITEKSRETLWLVLAGIIVMAILSVLIALFIPEAAHTH